MSKSHTFRETVTISINADKDIRNICTNISMWYLRGYRKIILMVNLLNPGAYPEAILLNIVQSFRQYLDELSNILFYVKSVKCFLNDKGPQIRLKLAKSTYSIPSYQFHLKRDIEPLLGYIGDALHESSYSKIQMLLSVNCGLFANKKKQIFAIASLPQYIENNILDVKVTHFRPLDKSSKLHYTYAFNVKKKKLKGLKVKKSKSDGYKRDKVYYI